MLTDSETTRHVGYLLRSFHRVVGLALLPSLGDAIRDAQQLFAALFVV